MKLVLYMHETDQYNEIKKHKYSLLKLNKTALDASYPGFILIPTEAVPDT